MKILKESVVDGEKHIFYTKDGVSISHKVVEPIQSYVESPSPSVDDSLAIRVYEVENTLNFILLGGI